MDDMIIQRVREGIKRRHESMTPEEWFADMVKRGVIDEKGRVLRRMPEPPKKPRKAKKPSARS